MGSSGVINAVRTAILLLAVVIFLGNIMMWIIMPTDTYYNIWVPHLMAATNSTFFEIQGLLHVYIYFFLCFSWCLFAVLHLKYLPYTLAGPIMMDFTFPILLIAVLGCIYLHLGKKTNVITARYDYIQEFSFNNTCTFIILSGWNVSWNEQQQKGQEFQVHEAADDC